jgi:hypothetical protein
VTTTPPGTGVLAEVTTTTSVRLPTVGRESGRTAGAAWLIVAVGLSVMVLRRVRVVEK